MLVSKTVQKGDNVKLVSRSINFINRNNIILNQPVDYIHHIDKKSPFYGLTEKTFNNPEESYEIVAYLGGIRILKPLSFKLSH